MPIDELKAQRNAAMDDALNFYTHLRDCVGLSQSDACHVMIGAGLFLIAEDMPLDEALEHLDAARQMLDEQQDELLARRS